MFHLSFNVYLLKLCHKHKWLQDFLYALQNKKAFLLNNCFLEWNICRSGRRTASYCIELVFIRVQGTSFIQGYSHIYGHIEGKAYVNTLCCSSSSSAEHIFELKLNIVPWTDAGINISNVYWIDKVAQLPFFVFRYAHTLSLEDGQRRADRHTHTFTHTHTHTHTHTFTHAPTDRSSSCRLRRNAVFERLCCRRSDAPFIQEHKYEFSRFL